MATDPAVGLQLFLDACVENTGREFKPVEGTKYTGSHKKIPILCVSCGEIRKPVRKSVVGTQRCDPCKACSAVAGGRKRRHDAETAIQEVIDVCARRGQPIARTPNTAYEGNQVPIEFLCLSCDETCSPTYGNVVSTGAGPCGTCAKYGFNKNAATKLYFLEHTEKGLAKIGITNVSTSGAYDRVADFTRLGWWERSRTVFDTGREAEAVEQNIHRKLREMGHQVDEKAARKPAATSAATPKSSG